MSLSPQTAIDELTELQGLDLEPDESLRLLNEFHTELCVRSEWTRKTIELGPTVADQAAYAFTDEINRPLDVWLEGRPLTASDPNTVSEIGDRLRLRARGLWWISDDVNGAKGISIYPTPSQAGLSLTALCVVYPDEFAADGAFAVPPDFRRAIVNAIRSLSLGQSEDDTDREALYSSAFESEVQRLRRHRIALHGRKGIRMKIEGVNA